MAVATRSDQLISTNNRRTPPYYGHASVREYPDSSMSKVLTVLKWRMITTLNRKLLEKQRVQNRFASYEVHIGHFFYNINAAVSFGNRLKPCLYSDFKIFHRTDRQKKTDCLTPSRMRARGNETLPTGLILYSDKLSTHPFLTMDRLLL